MDKLLRQFLREAKADTGRVDPYKNFRFEVEISGGFNFGRAGFNKVSGLKMETEVIEYREGGYKETPTKTAGLTKFDPITLERGQTQDEDVWDWATKLYDHNKSNQTSTDDALANMRIKLKDRDGSTVRVWVIPDCWVSVYETGDFDAQSNAIMVEKMTIQHEGFYVEK